MFSTRIPRSSFLDSPMRLRSRENRRLAHETRPSPSPYGHGPRHAPALPTVGGRLRDGGTLGPAQR